MANLTRFEDLTVWRRSRRLTRSIYRITSIPPFSRDFGLKDQTRRAAVSVMANIAEGFGTNSLRGFLRYLQIAQGSASELRCHLYIALDAGLVDRTAFDRLALELDHVARLLRGLSRSLREKLTPRH